MGDKQQVITHLTQVKRELLAKKEHLLRPVQQVDKDLEYVSGTLAILLRDAERVSVTQSTIEFPISKIRKMTQRQAVVEIARQNGGILKAQDAKRILMEAGLIRSVKYATNMAHNAILQSGAFDRIGKGEFRLKESKSKSDEPSQLFRQLTQ